MGPEKKVTASRLTKKYVKSTFEKKKDETWAHVFLDSTGNYKITSERINALAI